MAVLSVAMAVASAGAQVRLVSAKPGNGTPPAEPAYVDRVMEGVADLEREEAREEVPYDRAGWPRFLRLETKLGTQPMLGSERSLGFAAAGAIMTPNHGTLSIDANFAPDEGRNAITVRQRELPVEGGWLVNNEIGVTSSLAPGLMRLPSRIFVPTQFLRGVTTEWLNPALQTQLQAASGQPGVLQGYPGTGFFPFAGTLTSVGAEKRFGALGAAIRYERGNNISLVESPFLSSQYFDSNSAHAVVRAESGAHTVQLNAVATRSTETSDVRRGAWIEGEWKHGTALYGWGFLRLDPRLSWSGQGMSSDTEGAYARGSWRTRQWSAEANVDALRSISRPDQSGVYVSGSGRWRYSRSLALGAGGSIRDYGRKAGSAFADVRVQSEWGNSGLRADGTNDRLLRTRRLAFDHAWHLQEGWALNAGISVGKESGEKAAGSLWGAAISLSAPISDAITLLGNASTERRETGTRSSGANLNLLWRLNRNWSIAGNFLYSQGRQAVSLPLDPLAPPPERLLLPNDSHSYFLVLRYEGSAGSQSVPLGGTGSTGGGSIEGVVFLDANRSGAQEAGEKGAPGVTVYLDGRYAVRTDSQGRFEFPFVGPGTRVIRVLNETLPLPWEIGEQQETRVEVVVREAARVAIPAVKRGE